MESFSSCLSAPWIIISSTYPGDYGGDSASSLFAAFYESPLDFLFPSKLFLMTAFWFFLTQHGPPPSILPVVGNAPFFPFFGLHRPALIATPQLDTIF